VIRHSPPHFPSLLPPSLPASLPHPSLWLLFLGHLLHFKFLEQSMLVTTKTEYRRSPSAIGDPDMFYKWHFSFKSMVGASKRTKRAIMCEACCHAVEGFQTPVTLEGCDSADDPHLVRLLHVAIEVGGVSCLLFSHRLPSLGPGSEAIG